MKKDIPKLKVQDLAIAIAPREGALPEEELWDSYILNLKDEPIKNVLVNSRGYGVLEGKRKETSVLRHFFDEIGPLEILKIEPIQVKVFDLTNEYWVSFVYEGHMYDKKYIFVPGSISNMNFTPIPFLNRHGVMIR